MKSFFVFCGICCFAAIAKWPIEYYTFLRIVVSLGAILAIYHFFIQKNYWWAIIFGFTLILFNPILPIHFYRKNFWIPFDILAGLLFYALVFFKKKEIIIVENQEIESPKKNHTRDRIISPKKPNL